MIIDMHMHVDDLPAIGWSMDAGLCLQELDRAGIDKGVVMTIVDLPEVNPHGLEFIADAIGSHPGR